MGRNPFNKVGVGVGVGGEGGPTIMLRLARAFCMWFTETIGAHVRSMHFQLRNIFSTIRKVPFEYKIFFVLIFYVCDGECVSYIFEL